MNEIEKWIHEYGGWNAVESVISTNPEMKQLKDRLAKYVRWRERLNAEIKEEGSKIDNLQDNYGIDADYSDISKLYGEYMMVDHSIQEDWNELKIFLQENRYLF